MYVLQMIHSILVIDGDSGISLLEHQMKSDTEQLSGFFQAINHIIDDLRENLQDERTITNRSRIILLESNNIFIHYHSEGQFLVCVFADADDNNEKILKVIETLSRRFWQKHQMDIEQFRFTNQKDIFKAFLIDIKNFTFNGTIAEKFPKLIVSENTLNRLVRMEMISTIEETIANMCQGSTSPLQISRDMQIGHESVTEMLKKLTTLDILKY